MSYSRISEYLVAHSARDLQSFLKSIFTVVEYVFGISDPRLVVQLLGMPRRRRKIHYEPGSLYLRVLCVLGVPSSRMIYPHLDLLWLDGIFQM